MEPWEVQPPAASYSAMQSDEEPMVRQGLASPSGSLQVPACPPCRVLAMRPACMQCLQPQMQCLRKPVLTPSPSFSPPLPPSSTAPLPPAHTRWLCSRWVLPRAVRRATARSENTRAAWLPHLPARRPASQRFSSATARVSPSPPALLSTQAPSCPPAAPAGGAANIAMQRQVRGVREGLLPRPAAAAAAKQQQVGRGLGGDPRRRTLSSARLGGSRPGAAACGAGAGGRGAPRL